MNLKILSLSLLLLAFANLTWSQVCSPIGGLCQRTVDCCKGCCEAHVCIDRDFACSSDLIAQPGSNSCINYYCPPGQFCYLREVCPPENQCPRQPVCRRYDSNYNYSNPYYRNTAFRVSPSFTLFTSFSFIIFCSVY